VGEIGYLQFQGERIVGREGLGFNDLIHNILPKVVLESVACIPPGLEQSAWEIFFLAFQKKIAKDLFVEATHHAEQWERKLRVEKNNPHFLILDFGNHFWNRNL
jgi:hypothetical protein